MTPFVKLSSLNSFVFFGEKSSGELSVDQGSRMAVKPQVKPKAKVKAGARN